MGNSDHGQQIGPKAGERDRTPVRKAKKQRKPGGGRPKGSKNKPPAGDLALAEKTATRQRRIIARQRKDCERLATVIRNATPGTEDAKDIGALARATNLLHDMERSAHDFGSKGAQVKAVIVIPAGPATMEAWAKEADKVLGQAVTSPVELVQAQVIEDDVQGDAPPEPEEEEPES